MIMAACLLMTSVSAQALTLKCTNAGRKMTVKINEEAKTIQVAEAGNHTYDFKISDKKTYEVAGTGVVESFSITDGEDILGSSVSGELAILNGGTNVALELLNVSLANHSVRIENMTCKK